MKEAVISNPTPQYLPDNAKKVEMLLQNSRLLNL